MLIVTALPGRHAFAQAERKFIREGNRLYHKEQFDDSELSYRRALEKDEDSPQARFNLGNSLYKQERFDEALRYFEELEGEIDDPVNRSMVLHNMGNSLLMSRQVEQSIEAYKEALRNNPGDQETRYNLAFAQNLLDESDDQSRNNDNDQEGDDQDRQGDEDDQTSDGQDQQGEENDQTPDGQDREEDSQSPGRDQESQPQPGRISPEEALRMLEAAEREDQGVQEKLMEKKASERQRQTGRNW